MTLITLVWIIRSRATGHSLFERTVIDKWIALFLLAYVVSLFNVESHGDMVEGIKTIWRQLTAVAFFYLITMFVDTEEKFERTTKVMAVAGAIVAFTGLMELFFPGLVLIPGWIEFQSRLGTGTLGYRIEGIRVGGAVGSHSILSDYSSFTLLFMIVHFIRSRNILEKTFWLGLGLMTFAVLLSTANRGAVFSMAFGFLYSLIVFRQYMTLFRYVMLIAGATLVFGVTQAVLEQHTLAASVTDRIVGTQFEGMIPDSRVGVWEETFRKCFDHIFIGHGPYYQTGKGLVRVFWPHNGYLYYLYTLGLFGLGAFLMIAYKLYRLSMRYSLRLIHGSFLGVGMAVLHVILAMFLFGQMRTDHQRHTDFVYIYIVWMIFGLIVANGKILDRRIREHEAPTRPANSRKGS
jgi:O-antigen ligase